jgi:hypothetical protein
VEELVKGHDIDLAGAKLGQRLSVGLRRRLAAVQRQLVGLGAQGAPALRHPPEANPPLAGAQGERIEVITYPRSWFDRLTTSGRSRVLRRVAYRFVY